MGVATDMIALEAALVGTSALSDGYLGLRNEGNVQNCLFFRAKWTVFCKRTANLWLGIVRGCKKMGVARKVFLLVDEGH